MRVYLDANVILYIVAFFFFLFMAVAANPFELIKGTVPLDGRGPNPLLQNQPAPSTTTTAAASSPTRRGNFPTS